MNRNWVTMLSPVSCRQRVKYCGPQLKICFINMQVLLLLNFAVFPQYTYMSMHACMHAWTFQLKKMLINNYFLYQRDQIISWRIIFNFNCLRADSTLYIYIWLWLNGISQLRIFTYNRMSKLNPNPLFNPNPNLYPNPNPNPNPSPSSNPIPNPHQTGVWNLNRSIQLTANSIKLNQCHAVSRPWV